MLLGIKVPQKITHTDWEFSIKNLDGTNSKIDAHHLRFQFNFENKTQKKETQHRI